MEMTCQSCRGISVGAFCTFLAYCQIPWTQCLLKSPAGRSHTLVFRTIDYQLVIKCSVETRPKKACVSTLYLKWCLIISELQNAPWPRPDTAFHGEVFLCHSTLESDVMDEFLL